MIIDVMDKEKVRNSLQALADAIYYRLIPYVLSRRPYIVNWIFNAYNRRNSLVGSDLDDALVQLIEIILSRSYRLPKPIGGLNFEMLKKRLQDFSNSHEKLLEWVLGQVQSKPEYASKIEELKEYYESGKNIGDFIQDLYKCALRGETIIVGPKGRDVFLRDWGFIDRCPIDKHWINFMWRTGILWGVVALKSRSLAEIMYTVRILLREKKKEYILRYNLYHNILETFCREFLRGRGMPLADSNGTVIYVDFGFAVGVLDWFVWIYCSEAKQNLGICRDRGPPRCEDCVIGDVCAFLSWKENFI